jgi:Zn-dependent protease
MRPYSVFQRSRHVFYLGYFFSLIPIPPLDSGQLALETLRGSTIAKEEQLIRASSWITAVLTIVTAESAYFLFDNWR